MPVGAPGGNVGGTVGCISGGVVVTVVTGANEVRPDVSGVPGLASVQPAREAATAQATMRVRRGFTGESLRRRRG